MLTRLALKYVAERHDGGFLNDRSAEQVRCRLLSFTVTCHAKPSSLNRRHIERWMAVPNLSPAYRRTRLSAMRGFCRWLVLNGHCPRDPTIGIQAPKMPRYTPRALPMDDSLKLVQTAPDSRTRLILLLLLQEALRRAEVAAIQLGDIDTRRKTLGVRGKGGRGKVSRVVPISDETWAAMDTYLTEYPATAGPLIRSRVHPDRGVTPGHVGMMVLWVMRDAGVKQANGDGRSAHACRHTAAHDMLDNGATVHQIQHALGHATLKTTEIYISGATADLRGAMGGRSYTQSA